MKLLLNDKEIAHFLNSKVDIYQRTKNQFPMLEPEMRLVHGEFYEKKLSDKVAGQKMKHFWDDRAKSKFYAKIKKAINRDTRNWVKKVKEYVPKKKEYNF